MSCDHELDIEHEGKDYIVHLDLEWEYEDTSFDGHLYGRVHTFKQGHWIVGDYRVILCLLIGESDSEEVEVEDIAGLDDAIRDKVSEMTRDTYDRY